MWIHSLIYIMFICIALFLTATTVEMNDRFYCNEERGVYFNESGYATIPMEKTLNDKVSEGNKRNKLGGVELCFDETEIIYDDYIRMLNLELPITYKGKVNKKYQPCTYLIKFVVGVIPGYLKEFGKKYIFDASDPSIYEGVVDTDRYVDSAMKIGLYCLDNREDDTDKCLRAEKFMACIIKHADFDPLRLDTFKIRVLGLEQKKKELEKKNKENVGLKNRFNNNENPNKAKSS